MKTAALMKGIGLVTAEMGRASSHGLAGPLSRENIATTKDMATGSSLTRRKECRLKGNMSVTGRTIRDMERARTPSRTAHSTKATSRMIARTATESSLGQARRGTRDSGAAACKKVKERCATRMAASMTDTGKTTNVTETAL